MGEKKEGERRKLIGERARDECWADSTEVYPKNRLELVGPHSGLLCSSSVVPYCGSLPSQGFLKFPRSHNSRKNQGIHSFLFFFFRLSGLHLVG